jgi:antitoxin (DNA-binding transcriptional repressor) of toxin-antitoxin stability system
MQSVGIKILKNKLSEYVRRAAGGETVLITDRDRVVAELGPPEGASRRPRRKLSSAELIAKGMREGWLTPAVNPDAPLPPRRPMTPLNELLAELDWSREDRDLSR